MAHRGTFQAQGSGVQKEEPWSQTSPLLYKDGVVLLQNLEDKLTKPERKARVAGLGLCKSAIKRFHEAGGLHFTGGVIKKSFPNGRSVRIDLDLFIGSAFV